MDYVYPPIEKRRLLDNAFDSLDNHIKNPKALLSILLSSGGLLLRYGRHLPKILRTAMLALQSFKTANQFEQKLVQKAEELKIKTSINSEIIEDLIRHLSRNEIDEFIQNSQTLFSTIQDKRLIINILHIVESLILKMKKRPNDFSDSEIASLEIGRDIIQGSFTLFEGLSSLQKQKLFEVVLEIEQKELNKIFDKKNKSIL